jgi:hypothetical protein
VSVDLALAESLCFKLKHTETHSSPQASSPQEEIKTSCVKVPNHNNYENKLVFEDKMDRSKKWWTFGVYKLPTVQCIE